MSLKEIKKPFNLIMFIIAIVSISLTIFFYLNGQKERKPVYQIAEPYSIVYDSSVSSPKISVIDSSGKLIQDDIYLITISFWNAGDLPIEPEDVRSSVILHIKPISRLLDFSIITQTDPNIIGFTLSEIPQSPSSTEGQLLLSWTHLDPGEGARFQIIYTGQKDSAVSFSGNILDVHKISNNNPSSQSRPISILLLIIALLSIIVSILGILLMRASFLIGASREYKGFKVQKAFIWVSFIISVIFSLYIIIIVINQISAKPPF